MKKSIAVIGAVLGTILLAAAAGSSRPTLSSCGKHLPPNAQFSVEIDAYWDRRPDSMRRNIQIIYRNQAADASHDGLTEELEPFGECVQAALGR